MEPGKQSGYRYTACVEGHIGEGWDWPESITITHTFDRQGKRAVSVITADLPDQPALYSLMEKFRDLNLKLIYAQREEQGSIFMPQLARLEQTDENAV